MKELPLLDLCAAPGGSSAHGGPGRTGARLRLGLAEGAKQLSPRALDALGLSPGSAQVSSAVPQQWSIAAEGQAPRVLPWLYVCSLPQSPAEAVSCLLYATALRPC